MCYKKCPNGRTARTDVEVVEWVLDGDWRCCSIGLWPYHPVIINAGVRHTCFPRGHDPPTWGHAACRRLSQITIQKVLSSRKEPLA